jgi:pectate lyase
MWQWEDAPASTTSKIGDYDWFGWAYFKISFCGYIWIDHCTFGKSYDGQIDYSNPVYNANAGTAFRAPLDADGGNGLHVSWCSFNAGSDDESGYLYKMMTAIEESYQKGESAYLYYNKLRDGGASFEEILYGIAIPQKKGFLCGDNAKFSGSYDNADDYNYNLKLCVSFGNCRFINLEDRLPKLRGGNAYIYNCIVDGTQYYSYRTKLQSLGASSLVAAVNSSWKCGLVSQGIVCGNGGSVMAENCIFKGVQYLLKNNDTNNSAPYSYGGYCLVNCSYQQSATSAEYIGSSSEAGNKFTNATTSILSTANFAWHTSDGSAPFEVTPIDLTALSTTLADPAFGALSNTTFQTLFLKSIY